MPFPVIEMFSSQSLAVIVVNPVIELATAVLAAGILLASKVKEDEVGVDAIL